VKQLAETAVNERAKLARVEHEARDLLAELDSLDVRLHRAHNAVSIDNLVAYLSRERERMLEIEKSAKFGSSLAGVSLRGVVGLVCLCRRQKPDWDTLVSMFFPKEPFGDIRVAVNGRDVRLVNVAKIARERNTDIASVIANLEQEGNEILHWEEFEARAKNMRKAALSGKLELEEGHKQAPPTGG